MRVSENRTENNQPSAMRKVTGITVGAAIGLYPTVATVKSILTPITDKRMIKNKKNMANVCLPMDSFDTVKKLAEDIITKTGLKDKGVTLEVFTPESIKTSPLSESATLRQKMTDTINKNIEKQIANGLNACFRPKQNNIRINDKGFYSTVFHEIGHALNFNDSNFMRFLQKNRGKSMIATPIVAVGGLFVGLFHNKKSSKNKNNEHKTMADFIHNNAGKLTFLAFLPVLLEEGMASIKGIKLAKPYLTEKQHKLHIRNLSIAYCSYLFTPIILGGAVALGIFVKDKIVAHKTPSHKIESDRT